MTRRLPVLATLLVLAAAGVMIALGMWQLQRRDEKEALLALYQQARSSRAEAAWPRTPGQYPAALYRRARLRCERVEGIAAVAGRSAAGRAGWAQIARCRLPDGAGAAVALGWSARPDAPRWAGGVVSGTIGPAGRGVRLIAAPAQAGLEPLAPPDPKDVPNNHLSYAMQWFLFAATALVIYALALRQRWTAGES